MKLSKRIILLWLGVVTASLLCYPVLGQVLEPASFLSYAMQFLLFIMSVSIARNEPTGKNRVIFINFAIFFGIAPVFHFYNFLSFLFPPALVPTVRWYFTQYVALGAYFFLLALAIVYLAVDALFREFRAVQKYILALAIVGGFFGYYYAPYLIDARHVYKTEQALNWKELNEGYEKLRGEYDAVPTPQDLAAGIAMHSWRDGVQVGVLYPEERFRRAVELYPYLTGNNYIILLTAPLYRNVIYMNVLCVGFILLFFGYQYRKDPPQGAYIEKIMFFLFLFCSMEIVHAWSFIKSIEWRTFHQMTSIGQYVSASILLMISVFFAFRLKFIRSVNGEFYEVEIVSRPTGITRWRDWLDDLVIAHFFNRRAILGRLFVRDSRTKEG
jgi:hypothetical protein